MLTYVAWRLSAKWMKMNIYIPNPVQQCLATWNFFAGQNLTSQIWVLSCSPLRQYNPTFLIFLSQDTYNHISDIVCTPHSKWLYIMVIIMVVPVVPYIWQLYLILAITVPIIITSRFSNWDCNCCCNQFFNNPMLIQRSEIQGCWQWSPSWRRSGAIPSEETWSTTESSFFPWRSPWVGAPDPIKLDSPRVVAVTVIHSQNGHPKLWYQGLDSSRKLPAVGWFRNIPMENCRPKIYLSLR